MIHIALPTTAMVLPFTTAIQDLQSHKSSQTMFLSLLLGLFLSFSLILSSCFLPIKKGFTNGSPPSYPLIGCLISFYQNRRRLLQWYTDLLAESPTLTTVVSRIGARRTVVTANPENIEYILKTNFNNYPKGKPFTEIVGDFLGQGIFSTDGQLWSAQRKLASHEFSTRSLRDFLLKILEEDVKDCLFPLLDSAVENKTVIDLQDVLKRLTFNAISKLTLGVDPGCLDLSRPILPLASAFDKAAELIASRGSMPVSFMWKIKRYFNWGSEVVLKDQIKIVHEYIDKIIREKRIEVLDHEKRDSEGDILSRLILSGNSNEAIRDTLISFLMAGRDTTSSAMTWLFWLLTCHRNVESDIIKEVAKKGKCLNFDDLKDMNFLKACLCESMRLYPPVAWDSKHAAVADVLPDGTHVQAGDRVTYFPYGMGRMEKIWGKDMLEFRPDRWLDEPGKEDSGLKSVSAYKFPVFQAGPRVCLGKEMAFTQMKYVVSSVLQRFEFVPVCLDKPVFVPFLTAYMAGGLKVKVHRR